MSLSLKNKPPQKLIALRGTSKVYERFPFTEEGVEAAVQFLQESDEKGMLYTIDYHIHHPGTVDEEWLPRPTKVMEVHGEKGTMFR